MGNISDAVNEERISRVVGYKIQKGNFATVSPNLPQRVAVFTQANTENQATFPTEKTLITSAKQAGELYGWGSPAHLIARILFPKSGSGIGGVPVYFHVQPETQGALEKVLSITPSGVATDNGTHYVKLSGRKGLDGESYAINIVKGDTAADINGKISDAINNILGAPATAVDTDYEVTLTSKWKGLTADEMNVEIDTNNKDLGITYAVAELQSGTGTPSVSDALNEFGNDWTTIVLNSYGLVTEVLDELEAFNGVPNTEDPTGRFKGIIMKPFVAITGSTSEDPSSISDARKEDVTIAIAPAPNSLGFSFEAAANMTVLQARCAQDTPHLDVAGKSYPDMPTPLSIGTMSEYENRDAIVKKGCSTVSLKSEKYQVEDFVTTYHPIGESPAQFKYVRNLYNIDLNVYYRYYLLEQLYVVDHVIAKDTDTVNAPKVVKPKQWKQILGKLATDLVTSALTVDDEFMKSSLNVGLSVSNPDRLETSFDYKRSGFVRIASTNATAGFNLGTLE
jgi:phage tail sheath gpL-like